MDFEAKVAAFTRKKKSQNLADLKRDAYRTMLKEYQALKYSGAVVDGARKEVEITQERIEKAAKDKAETKVETADDLAQYLEIDLEIGVGGDLDMGEPKKGKRK